MQPVINLFDREISGDSPTTEEWSAARSTAKKAATSEVHCSLSAVTAQIVVEVVEAVTRVSTIAGATRSAAEAKAREISSMAGESKKAAVWVIAEAQAWDKYANHLIGLFETVSN